MTTEKRNDVIQIRVSAEEKAQLGQLASECGSSLSEFVRRAALDPVRHMAGLKEAASAKTFAEFKGVPAKVEFKEKLDKIIERDEPVLDRLAAGPPEECPYTAKQLRGKSNGALTLSAAERAIEDGTWRRWL